jgi:hypothetical protein
LLVIIDLHLPGLILKLLIECLADDLHGLQ